MVLHSNDQNGGKMRWNKRKLILTPQNVCKWCASIARQGPDALMPIVCARMNYCSYLIFVENGKLFTNSRVCALRARIVSKTHLYVHSNEAFYAPGYECGDLVLNLYFAPKGLIVRSHHTGALSEQVPVLTSLFNNGLYGMQCSSQT